MKYIACPRSVPELAPIFKEMEEFKTRTESEMKFMAKQMKNRAEEFQKESRTYWDKIEKILLEKNMIEKKHTGPENENWCMEISNDDQLFLIPREDKPHPLDILRKILR